MIFGDTGVDILHDHYICSQETECSSYMQELMTMGGGTEWLLVQSPVTELFTSGEISLGNCLEMARHLAVTHGRDSTCSQVAHIMAMKCMSWLYSVLVCRGNLMIGLENVLERKKIYVSGNGLERYVFNVMLKYTIPT